MKKLNKCPGGRYTELQHKLLQESEIKCEVCLGLLDGCGFNSADMHTTVDAWVAGTYQTCVKEGLLDHRLKQNWANIDDDDEFSPTHGDRKAECLAYIKTLSPIMYLLPEFTLNKKVPIQCKVCTSKNWPNGRVIDGCFWKVDSIKHFVKQHCRSNRHLKKVRQINRGVVTMNRVPCMGLCILDSERNLQVYRFREEFRLWASHSNFEGSAKHTYWHVRNEDAWYVRAATCERECDETNLDYQTCPVCLDLGSAHGVAMNLVPLLHCKSTLADRCETGIAGFVTIDIMRFLAEILCKKMGAPTGSTFLAPQTATNIQASCLSGILLCITKDANFEPWKFGEARLTELPIEEFFSFCRRQSANSQLSARAYFHAAARVALRNSNLLNKEKVNRLKGEKALTREQPLVCNSALVCFCKGFKTCCEKGFRGAIKLASFVSGKSEEWIEENYRAWCDSMTAVSSFDAELQEDEMPEEGLELDADQTANACHELLSQIQAESSMVDPEIELDAVDIPENDHVETAFDKLTDKEDLSTVLEGSHGASADDGAHPEPAPAGDSTTRSPNYLPKTLLEAMTMQGDTFNALWRFTLRMRSAEGGVDRRWVANPQKARRASRDLNWHQPLGEYPDRGDGQVRITLSSASSDVLSRVSNLRRWNVAPPMTRGSKAVVQEAVTDPVVPQKKNGKNKDNGKGKVVKLHVKKPKIKAGAPAKPTVPVGEHTADSIRRNNNGRAAVVDLVADLIDTDSKIYASAPAFNTTNGACLFRFEGGHKITQQMIMDAAPLALEAMYKYVKSSSAFGKTVWRHIDAAKKSLEKETPNRKPFVRLMKDIVEFIQCESGNVKD
eukprot:Skav206806  [mRNA]  locus=scaffold1990:253368:261683:- [translate_table: standard]